MSFQFITIFCTIFMITSADVISHEIVSAPPKFGDRIGKLKRNFKVTTTIAPTTTKLFSTTDYERLFKNDIHRSDDYLSSDDHENKKFFILKKFDEDEIENAVNSSLQSRNNTLQSQSPPSAMQARLEMLTDFFDVPSSPLLSMSTSRPSNIPKSGVVLAAKNFMYPTNSTYKHKVLGAKSSSLRQEGWVVPVLVLAAISMFIMGSFEIFVLCKTRQTSPNRRHLFLGQMLLLGLFCSAGLSAVLTAYPTVLSCSTIRFGAGVSFAIIFASLLVKCIFLISLNGGVYLPAVYQGLFFRLLFAVLIQITINIQWLLNQPAGVTYLKEISHTNRLIFTAENLTSIQLCKTSFSQLRVSFIYIDFLIITVAILAIKSRGIRDNYREATYIGLSIALVIPVWLGFTLVGLGVHEKHKDACLAFGLLATPTIVFFVMFMPKGRQLAAMGREDIYLEDREERFSASSRAGSGYSPSFFHFKPIKYGVMSGKSSGSKHQQAVGTIGDDYALSFYSPRYKYSYHHNLPNSNSTEKTPMYYFLHKPPSLLQNSHKGLFIQDDAYTTLEQTTQHSSNPNVYFQRSNMLPGMIY